MIKESFITKLFNEMVFYLHWKFFLNLADIVSFTQKGTKLLQGHLWIFIHILCNCSETFYLHAHALWTKLWTKNMTKFVKSCLLPDVKNMAERYCNDTEFHIWRFLQMSMNKLFKIKFKLNTMSVCLFVCKPD